MRTKSLQILLKTFFYVFNRIRGKLGQKILDQNEVTNALVKAAKAFYHAKFHSSSTACNTKNGKFTNKESMILQTAKNDLFKLVFSRIHFNGTKQAVSISNKHFFTQWQNMAQ